MKVSRRILPYRFVKIDKLTQLKDTVESLESQISAARSFIKEIESGNLSADNDSTDALQQSQNALGSSLLSMR